MSGVFDREEMWLLEIWKQTNKQTNKKKQQQQQQQLIFEYNTGLKWSSTPMKFKSQDLYDLLMEKKNSPELIYVRT